MNARRRTPAAGRRINRRLLPLAGAGVAILGLIAAAAFGLGRESGGGPIAWATLDTADVHAMAFAPDDREHLYFGHHGGLLESGDGGRSWQPAPLSGTDAMNVKTATGGRIQVAGHDVYLESIDGGASWQPVPHDLPGLDLHAFAVDPADADHAWTFAVGFGLFETTDAGRHWELRQPGNWGFLAAYRTSDRTALVAAGPEGLVRSIDAGATWEPLAYPGAPLAGGIAAAADGSVLYAATGAGLRHSSDQGQTWAVTAFTGVALALAIAPDDPMDVVLVDDATRFFRSPDGGASWPAP
ncbi:MAG: hypothetical protein H0U86_05345 [Chloroflexi bacterium]|nr:hypothetical protein [Chloroflexota bacterium]